MTFTLGLDLGTSGVRTAVLGADGTVLSTARANYPPMNAESIDAEAWWTGATACIAEQGVRMRASDLDPADISVIAVDGTSGTMVLTDAGLRPVTRGLMYNSAGFDAEAAVIAKHAPDPHITRGSGSALARAMRLMAEDQEGDAVHLLHQADFIAARLLGRGGVSDYNNALKTGFDPDGNGWPTWLDAAGIRTALLPEVVEPGSAIAPIDAGIAARLRLSPDVMIHAGTTDSTAAFLAAAPLKIGMAVTSLGTTLAIKLLSEERVDAPELGLYSHRLGEGWLVGGASNTGGGVLRAFFDEAELAELSARIDPMVATSLDYYPLLAPGERFPVNDPALAPRLSPRPEDDAGFLHGLLEGMARIERQAYDAMAALGAPHPKAIYTAGGGARNPVWTAIRARVLGIELRDAGETEASIGTARLAMDWIARQPGQS